MIHSTRRCRIEIEFVRHGLFQKCYKESRLTIFGNRENILAYDFSRVFKSGSLGWLVIPSTSADAGFTPNNSPASRTLKLTFMGRFVELLANNLKLARPELDMKPNPLFSLKATLAVVAALFFITIAQAQTPVQRKVLVKAIAGEARYSVGGGEFEILSPETRVGKGDVIKTAVNSHVDLDMGNNVGIIQVPENSTCTIDEATITKTQVEALTDTQLSVSSGGIYAKVNKLAKGSRFEISTPKGIAGIRGTSIYLTAAGQLTVEKGLAGIAYGPGDVVLVREGETCGPNERPPHPASLLVLREMVEALLDCGSHGVWYGNLPFFPGFEPFCSPVLPNGKPFPGRGHGPPHDNGNGG
jgi:hypothetical protein